MLSNAQLINKAGAIQTGSLSHGLLNPEQAKKFHLCGLVNSQFLPKV